MLRRNRPRPGTDPSRGSGAARRVALALIVVAGLLPGPAGAQDPPEIDIKLLAQPVFSDSDDDLGLKLRVTNRGETDLEGLSLVAGVYFRTETRSGLADALDLSAVDASNSIPVADFDGVLPPGGIRDFTIDEPLTSFTVLGDVPGVYPLKVSLRDAAGLETLDSITTQLLYYPTTPDVRLKMVVLLPIEAPPRRGPDGVFHPDPLGNYPLERELAEGGRLASLADALDREADERIRLALAPSPRLLEEVADMAGGYRRAEGDDVVSVPPTSEPAAHARRFIADLRTLLQGPGTRLLLAPYASPDLPSIAESDSADTQITVGEQILSEVLGIRPTRRWLVPPGGRLDEASLLEITEAGVDHTFFSADSLEEPGDPLSAGCPIPELSLTCPVAVESAAEQVVGYTVDRTLQDRLLSLTQSRDKRVSLQQFLAETAMIREERPGEPGRVVQITIPPTWEPRHREISLLLRALRAAPWLETITAQEGFEQTEDRAPRRLVDTAEVLADQPDSRYFQSIQDLERMVEHFSSMGPPEAAIERLTRNVLVAQSRTWWEDPDAGSSYVDETEQEIEAEFAKIGIFGQEELEVALTSRRGEIPLTIVRNTDYPVEIVVRMKSSRLAPDPSALRKTIRTPQERVTFEVTASSSGTFPLDVQVETPDGHAIGEPKRITVRSTAYNAIALGITFGALAFVALFYLVRGLRKRKAKATGRGAETHSA